MWKRTIRVLPLVSAHCGRCATAVKTEVSKSTICDKSSSSVCRHLTARTQNLYNPRQRRFIHAAAVGGAVDPEYVEPDANPTHHVDHHEKHHENHHENHHVDHHVDLHHLNHLRSSHDHHHRHHHQHSEDPKELCRHFLANICAEIKCELNTSMPPLRELAHYLFNEKGKYVRPQIVYLLAIAANKTTVAEGGGGGAGGGGEEEEGGGGGGGAAAEVPKTVEATTTTTTEAPLINSRQLSVCRIAEMIHTASLIHDDIIDGSFVRRGEPTINSLWGELNAVITGDYILSVASHCLSETRDPEVVQIISQVVEDLVRGEFMQLGTKTDETLRFNHYLEKTYRKTASLLANHCKAVALLAGCDEERVEAAFQFGRNIGIAFQLVDDLLDFISTDEALGKPAAADLKLGLATAPVLFALDKHPDLAALIVRRFSSAGDVAAALGCVRNSDGVEQTKFLAAKFSAEAERNLEKFVDSNHRRALKTLTDGMLHRSS